MSCGAPAASTATRPADVETLTAPAGTVCPDGAIAGAGRRPPGGGGGAVGAGVGVAAPWTVTLWVASFVVPVTLECISRYSVWVPALRAPTVQVNCHPELFHRAFPK